MRSPSLITAEPITPTCGDFTAVVGDIQKLINEHGASLSPTVMDAYRQALRVLSVATTFNQAMDVLVVLREGEGASGLGGSPSAYMVYDDTIERVITGEWPEKEA